MRLRLDFTLDTIEERTKFLTEYLESIHFELTQEELEMAGNYILWGKQIDGQSAAKADSIYIPTRHKTWDKPDEESLDELLAQPTFNEATLYETPTKKVRPEFHREEARAKAPDYLKQVFEDLFEQIDRLDLIINYYDELHGKRKNPPRDTLLARFGTEEQLRLRAYASELNQFKYLKMRHELVELRRQQYTLRDSYAQTIQPSSTSQASFHHSKALFGDTIEVYPLGLIGQHGALGKIFIDEDILNPFSFSEKDLKVVSDFYWEKKEKKLPKIYFDFRKVEHLLKLFGGLLELEESIDEVDSENEGTHQLLGTLKYYQKFAHLNEMQEEILDMKINKKTNRDIQIYVNKKYGKSYTENYISTIFRQKILVSIADAAAYHEEIIGNLWFDENFKECNCCGEIYLLSARNFVRKARSKDGFSNTCKRCDKIKRSKNKK